MIFMAVIGAIATIFGLIGATWANAHYYRIRPNCRRHHGRHRHVGIAVNGRLAWCLRPTARNSSSPLTEGCAAAGFRERA
jgi:hypothetical protein